MRADGLKSTAFPRFIVHLDRVEGAPPTGGSGDLPGVARDVVNPAPVMCSGEPVEGRAAVSIPWVAWGLEDSSVFVTRAGKKVLVELHRRGVVGR